MTHFPETSATAKVSDKLFWRKRQRKEETLQSHCITALVLVGVELISFVVVSMKLGFGFMLETVLIVQGCFHYC